MISKEELRNLATLSRLDLTDEELTSFQADITNILAYVGQVGAVSAGSTVKKAPSHHNVMRADEPRSTEDTFAGKEEAVRAQFPRREGDFAVVRKIIQREE
jgi:aspartyl/glutamyl-tRNA(Asn/Gln) amidotransferase C subunit